MSRNAVVRVLFAAGLLPMRDGGTGGQVTVASTLFRSRLSSHVELIPFSTTMRSLPPPGLLVRAMLALQRLIRFYALLSRVDCVLVFLSDGLSLLEKAVYVIAARLCRKGVVVRFGGGALAAQCRANLVLRLVVRVVLRCAHVACVQSKGWREFFEGYGHPGVKFIETPNGLDFGPVPANVGGSRGVPGICFMGWLEHHKGITELLAAFDAVRERWPEVTLSVVGDGSLRGYMENWARERGVVDRVRFHGWVPHERVGQLISDAAVFVLPSHYEGLPNALLEAMSLGVPVIATKVGGIPEVLGDGCGMLVEAGDSGALADAILSLLAAPGMRESIGRKGMQRVRAKYSIEEVWPKFLSAIRCAMRDGVGGWKRN